MIVLTSKYIIGDVEDINQENLKAADYNQDNKIRINDVTKMLKGL